MTRGRTAAAPKRRAQAAPWREEALFELERHRFDVLVIGGGVVGAATAAAASQSGLTVALVEAADFGSGASSASSKLIHGGLRYLRMGDLGGVRRALAERKLLLTSVAPHLVRSQRFVLPIYRDGPHRPLAIRLALSAYGALAGDPRSGRVVEPAIAREIVPALQQTGLLGAGVYADAQTNDARICLENVLAARRDGAVVLNYGRVEALRRSRGQIHGAEILDVVGDRKVSVDARVVVNATGAAVDEVRRLEDVSAGTTVRTSKGVHLIAACNEPWTAALTIPVDATRVSFVLPWQGVLLLGTTDDPFDPAADSLEVTAGERAQILDEVSTALDVTDLRVLSAFAGLRVLPIGPSDVASSRREVSLSTGSGGMISVAGGKLTMHRRIGLAVLQRVADQLLLRLPSPPPVRLPGATNPRLEEALLAGRFAEAASSTIRHLVETYGSKAGSVLEIARSREEGYDRLLEDAPDIVAQVVYAAEHELAMTADDVLRRRTALALRAPSDEVRRRIEDLFTASVAP